MQHECKAIVAFRFEFRFARKSLQRIKNYQLTISKYLSSRIAFRFYPLKATSSGGRFVFIIIILHIRHRAGITAAE